ncbi:type IV secretory system conjugative DNA transfer family protein [Dactylosporangium roseum]|uniref:Type IV secretory system conjugative DNA transfer family protein n=1 Tax=Dactylosporangium roseum TaxID=47989 RepID=A0ABY5YYI5_9ACTN|nr:type IV secretory system conjugative DNA transfer family protein [Dactylosporangium roseum]UWZ34459.1 type IV secretory system conjugative DNA transfer family protein [Dactylosporangium roseum]
MASKPDDDKLGGQLIVALFGLGGCTGAVGAAFWLAGQLSAVLTGHGWPRSSLRHDLVPIILAWKDTPGDPARAWATAAGVLIGPAWLVYLIFLTLVALLGAVAFWLVKLSLNWRRRRGLRLMRLGFASGWEIRRLIGAKATVRRGLSARPAVARRGPVRPLDVGFFLGRDYRSREKLYASVEDTVLIVAPPRQGKDAHFCTPFTLDAPGACVVVTTGVEAFTTTYEHRAALGEVYVFDPNNMTKWYQRMRWSPVRGCESPDTADDRAKVFVKQAGFTLGDEGSYSVVTSAIVILRCYLHAAALHGKGIADVVAWATEPADPEPLRLLRRAEEARVGAPGWAKQLEASMQTDAETRSARWAAVVQSMSCLFDAGVQRECSPDPNEVFDVRRFVAGRNTLYVLGKERGVNPVTPLVTMLVEDLFGKMRAIAARMPGGRLEPPASFELNEAGFISPMASLPRYMGLMGKSSISLHVYLRSLSQARDKWGKEGAAAMWDHAAIRIVAGGGGTVEDLEEVSKLLGDIYTPSGESLGRRILTADEIRTMRFGRAVLVAREARPVEVRLTPWWRRPDARELAAAKADTEARLLQFAEHADGDDAVQRYIRSAPTT